MPRRRHTDKARHAGPMTFDEHRWWDYATRGELVDAFGSLDEARESYLRREPQLHTNPGTRMESFWALFAPELRNLPAELYTDPESWALVDRQKRGRAQWLLDHPEYLRGDADRAECERRATAEPMPFPGIPEGGEDASPAA